MSATDAHTPGARACSARALVVAALLALTAATPAADTRTLRIAVASSATETGLFDELVADFRSRDADTPVEIHSGGALAVLDDGRAGRADLVITHHRASEETFLEEGFGLRRVQIMYDEYAIFGPPADPLGLAREPDLRAALRRLASAEVPFLMPAAQSGTSRRIQQLWEMAGINPDWPGYESTGGSSATTLLQAAQFDSYTIANLGTYFAHRKLLAGSIAPLYRDHPQLRNTYSALVVSPERVPGARVDLAQRFLDYLVSDDGQARIARFGEKTYGTRLFTPAAHLDPTLQSARLAASIERKNLLLGLFGLLVAVLAASLVTLTVLLQRMRRAEAARRVSEERFVLAASGTNDAIWDWNPQNNETYFSPRWKELLGYVGYDDEIENTIDEWRGRIHPDDRKLVLTLLDSYLEGRSPHFTSQHRVRTKRGDYLWVLERVKALWDPQGRPLRVTGAATDVSERHLLAGQIEHQALYDVLTELPNRSLLLDRLEHAMHAARRHSTGLTVMVLNLNRFEEINQTYGHAAGDRVLREVAQRLGEILRAADTCARLGRDEFAVLLPDCNQQHAALPLHRILKTLEKPVAVDGAELQPAASIGLAFYPDHGDRPETLLQRAQLALHDARRAHRDYQVYAPAAAETASGDT